MPGAATSEIIFIAAMMVLILIVSFAAVYFFFRTYAKEKRDRLARSNVNASEGKNDVDQVKENSSTGT